jgi:cobalt/nickel transport system permease protein
MHIPSAMMHGTICPVTLAVAGAGVGWAVYLARKSAAKPTAARFAAVTALVFALQMLNYPVANGTSGHLLGAVLAASLLGAPFAVLAMAAVLAVQAFIFGDGGINALGANVINLALISAGAAGYLHQRLTARGVNASISLALAAWLSVAAGATACAFEVAGSGAITLGKVLPAMLSVHALIGAGEALLTLLVVMAINVASGWVRPWERGQAVGASVLALAAALLSPLASVWPDGLEWVAGRLGFTSFPAVSWPAIFSDYQVPWAGHPAAAAILAALAGALLVSLLALAVARSFRPTAARFQ